MDWSITTPIMLLVLVLALGLNIKKKVIASEFLIILLLNFSMLYCGYIGENEKNKDRQYPHRFDVAVHANSACGKE